EQPPRVPPLRHRCLPSRRDPVLALQHACPGPAGPRPRQRAGPRGHRRAGVSGPPARRTGDSGEPSVLVDVQSLSELEQRGDPDFDFERAWRAVQPDDVLTLIYTSGTTGPSKGVEITHANMLAECRAVASVLPVRPGARITSYLPSAH